MLARVWKLSVKCLSKEKIITFRKPSCNSQVVVQFRNGNLSNSSLQEIVVKEAHKVDIQETI